MTLRIPRELYGAACSSGRVGVQRQYVEVISYEAMKPPKHLDGQLDAWRNRPLDAGPYVYVWADALTMKGRQEGRVVNMPAWSGSA